MGWYIYIEWLNDPTLHDHFLELDGWMLEENTELEDQLIELNIV